jgi:hypothetical protein
LLSEEIGTSTRRGAPGEREGRECMLDTHITIAASKAKNIRMTVFREEGRIQRG